MQLFFRHGDNASHGDGNDNDVQTSSQSLTTPIPGNRLLTPEEMRQEEEDFINAMPPSPNYSSEALPGELSIPHHMAIDPVTLNESTPDEPPPEYTPVAADVANVIMRPFFSQTGGTTVSGTSTQHYNPPPPPRRTSTGTAPNVNLYQRPTGRPPNRITHVPPSRYQRPSHPPPQQQQQQAPPPNRYQYTGPTRMSHPSASLGNGPTRFSGRPNNMFPGNSPNYRGQVRHEIRAPLFVPSSDGSSPAPMTPERPPRLPNRRP
ncbi:unnamed protein product [Ambrosiozyma monospora]|uniref:Unnamed protein product n=1 Tax=Ambrosiozyma monospora TaxID=43982 RepID=A0A9W6YXD4_AMBMO|nr:unnamed protein product [Ambrosiozyma monospora]